MSVSPPDIICYVVHCQSIGPTKACVYDDRPPCSVQSDSSNVGRQSPIRPIQITNRRRRGRIRLQSDYNQTTTEQIQSKIWHLK